MGTLRSTLNTCSNIHRWREFTLTCDSVCPVSSQRNCHHMHPLRQETAVPALALGFGETGAVISPLTTRSVAASPTRSCILLPVHDSGSGREGVTSPLLPSCPRSPPPCLSPAGRSPRLCRTFLLMTRSAVYYVPCFSRSERRLLRPFLICAPTLPINRPQFQGTDATLPDACVKSHRPVESPSRPHCAGGTVWQTPLLCPGRHQPWCRLRSSHEHLCLFFFGLFLFYSRTTQSLRRPRD